jgi:NAD-dependent dihydropyrimidine dehydrogenase PreA subunit
MFNAAKPGENGKFTIDPALCQDCGACLNACPMEAISKL